MSEERSFTIQLEQLEGYQFKVGFDWPQVEALVVDEPAPLGEQQGPNAARLLAAAMGNCLSASLLYCLQKQEPGAALLRSTVTGTIHRNPQGRLRIKGFKVRIEVGDDPEAAKRLSRCTQMFEEFCVVTASVREGVEVAVEVVDAQGETIYSA